MLETNRGFFLTALLATAITGCAATTRPPPTPIAEPRAGPSFLIADADLNRGPSPVDAAQALTDLDVALRIFDEAYAGLDDAPRLPSAAAIAATRRTLASRPTWTPAALAEQLRALLARPDGHLTFSYGPLHLTAIPQHSLDPRPNLLRPTPSFESADRTPPDAPLASLAPLRCEANEALASPSPLHREANEAVASHAPLRREAIEAVASPAPLRCEANEAVESRAPLRCNGDEALESAVRAPARGVPGGEAGEGTGPRFAGGNAMRRGSSPRPPSPPPAVHLTPGPIPVLAIHTFDPASRPSLETLPAIAQRLRRLPAFIVDLRGNGGGDYALAEPFLQALTDRPLHRLDEREVRSPAASEGRANSARRRLAAGDVPPAAKPVFDAHIAAREAEARALRARGAPRAEIISRGVVVPGRADGPLRGRAVFLVDRGCASACEMMVSVARQIPGVIIAGEHTRGSMAVGELALFRLPASGVTISLGTRAFHDASGDFAETRGFLPDVPLEGGDLLAKARRLARGSAPSR